MGVIYKITNTIDDRVYIGSSINYERRHKEHINDIKNNKHHNIHLQRFCDKYGVNTLEFNVIEVCDNGVILEREQVFIDKHKNNSFNISDKSSAPMTGKKHTEESKIKMSCNNKGENNAMFGTKRPRWIVDKMIYSNINRLRTKRESVISRVNRKLRQEIIIKNGDKTDMLLSL
jgi:group I intron endonuclease